MTSKQEGRTHKGIAVLQHGKGGGVAVDSRWPRGVGADDGVCAVEGGVDLVHDFTIGVRQPQVGLHDGTGIRRQAGDAQSVIDAVQGAVAQCGGPAHQREAAAVSIGVAPTLEPGRAAHRFCIAQCDGATEAKQNPSRAAGLHADRIRCGKEGSGGRESHAKWSNQPSVWFLPATRLVESAAAVEVRMRPEKLPMPSTDWNRLSPDTTSTGSLETGEFPTLWPRAPAASRRAASTRACAVRTAIAACAAGMPPHD